MARFLSAEWFVAFDRATEEAKGEGQPRLEGPTAAVSLEIVVPDGPEGEVRYQVVVEGESAGARWRRDDLGDADVRFVTDYATICGIASGRLAAVEALAQGRARVSGNTARLAGFAAPVDLVPASLRASTTF